MSLQRELATQPWKKDIRTVTGIKKTATTRKNEEKAKVFKQRAAPLDMI